MSPTTPDPHFIWKKGVSVHKTALIVSLHPPIPWCIASGSFRLRPHLQERFAISVVIALLNKGLLKKENKIGTKCVLVPRLDIAQQLIVFWICILTLGWMDGWLFILIFFLFSEHSSTLNQNSAKKITFCHVTALHIHILQLQMKLHVNSCLRLYSQLKLLTFPPPTPPSCESISF